MIKYMKMESFASNEETTLNDEDDRANEKFVLRGLKSSLPRLVQNKKKSINYSSHVATARLAVM